MANPKPIPHSRVFEIQEDIAAWMKTDRAFWHIASDHVGYIRQARYPNRDIGYDALLARYGDDLGRLVLLEGQAVGAVTPTYCTSDFSVMAQTMADALTGSRLSTGDLTATNGLLVFQEPLIIEATRSDDRTLRGVRALSWHMVRGEDRFEPSVMIRYWSEVKNRSFDELVPGRTKLYAGGATFTFLGSKLQDLDIGVGKLLHAYFALLRSPVTSETIEPRNLKISPRTKRSLEVDTIRRVYLRHPEHARYEADEAAAAREGRAPVRAHWVRGHWRNQPYPRTGEVKWIWIDGYIKGNPENGTVASRKLLVARATPSEVQELVCA